MYIYTSKIKCIIARTYMLYPMCEQTRATECTIQM